MSGCPRDVDAARGRGYLHACAPDLPVRALDETRGRGYLHACAPDLPVRALDEARGRGYITMRASRATPSALDERHEQLERIGQGEMNDVHHAGVAMGTPGDPAPK